jgi:hypothetical protein
MKYQALMLPLLLIFFSCFNRDPMDYLRIYPAIQDKGDNNSFKKAAETDLTDPVVGFIHHPEQKNDIDFYKIRGLTPGASYRITVTPVPEADLILKVYQANGKPLFSVNEKGRGESEVLWEFRPRSDQEILSIESRQGFNDIIPYVINLTRKETSNEEDEPNNNEVQAVTINLDSEKKGYIAPSTDIDFYHITFPDARTYDFSVRIEALSNLDLNFNLINKKTGELKMINSNDWGGEEIFPYLSSSKGDYYLRISGKVSGSNIKEPVYYLSIPRFKPDLSSDEVYTEREFNDTPDKSTTLINETETEGCIFPLKDEDWYAFELYKKPLTADLSVSKVKQLDLKIDIFDSSHQLLHTINKYGKAMSEQISLNLDQGRYFVKISAGDSSLEPYHLFFMARYE